MVVQRCDILNEKVAVLDVDDEYVEEAEQDKRCYESQHQYQLVLKEYVAYQSPENTNSIVDDAQDVVHINFLGAEIDKGRANCAVNLASEGAHPGGHE